jgi:nucleotide-binding universal stress UspA family protein
MNEPEPLGDADQQGVSERRVEPEAQETGAVDNEEIVAVAVSPRTGSVASLHWGAREADRRHAELYAVSAWRGPHPPMTSGARVPAVYYDPDADLEQVVEDLEQHVQKVLGPDQKIICRVVHGSELQVLVKVSRRAVLLVVDAPKRAEVSSRVHSSRWFSRLLRSAQCPVVVLPPALLSDVAHYTGILPARRRKAEEL